jgi:hypothetical protein
MANSQAMIAHLFCWKGDPVARAIPLFIDTYRAEMLLSQKTQPRFFAMAIYSTTF